MKRLYKELEIIFTDILQKIVFLLLKLGKYKLFFFFFTKQQNYKVLHNFCFSPKYKVINLHLQDKNKTIN